MLPDKEDKPLVWTGKGNYRGYYSTIRDATRVYNKLYLDGYIFRDNKQCNYEKIVKHIKLQNKQIRTKYKDFPEVVASQILEVPSKDISIKFISMLEAAKNNEPNWREVFYSEIANSFNALADPNYRVVLRVTELRKTKIEYVKDNWLDKLRKDFCGIKIPSRDALGNFERHGSKAKSIFVSNQSVITEIPHFVMRNPSIEQVDLLIHDVLNDDDYYRTGERIGISSSQLRERQLDILDSIKDLKENFGNRIKIRVQYRNDIYCSEASLVITNLNWNNGKFKLCASATSIETLYQSRCYYYFYEDPNEYISQTIARQTSRFDRS